MVVAHAQVGERRQKENGNKNPIWSPGEGNNEWTRRWAGSGRPGKHTLAVVYINYLLECTLRARHQAKQSVHTYLRSGTDCVTDEETDP